MSTIRVNAIQNTTTTDGGISIDNSGHVSIEGQKLPSAGPLSNRNLIINGDMQVAQRSTAAVNNSSSVSTLTYETIDRWGYWASAGDDFSVQQVSDAPSGFGNSVKITSLATTTLSSGSYYTLSQRIEAQNLYLTDIGTSTAKDLTLSFWVKASNAATYSVYGLSSDYQESFTSTYTVNSADTWEHKTVTISGATSGFSSTGNSAQLEVGFSFGAGSNYSTSTLNEWQTSQFQVNASSATNLVETNAATLQITGVQLEVGSVATPFEHRSYADELFRCYRYYYKLIADTADSFGVGVANVGTIGRIDVRFPTEMNDVPDLETSGTAGDYRIGYRNSEATCTSVPSVSAFSKQVARVAFTVSDVLTAGDAIDGRSTGAGHYLAFDAEL